ncbi:MAG: serine/threonine-protein kinase PknK [Sandaracinaceae bacterium]
MSEEEQPNLPAGTFVGPYTLGEVLGRGGMGTVYASDSELHGPVAIKLLHGAAAMEPSARRRFEREAQIRVDSPYVARVRDAGMSRHGAWIAFERLEGRSLAEVIRDDGKLSVVRAVQVAREVTEGLVAAHAAGVVHRDLKASNIQLEKGHAKLLDFGIAHLLSDDATRLTAHGQLVGTPACLSPEQASGSPNVTVATDIWAVGILFYEMLAGRSPFERATTLATVLAVMVEQPLSLSMLAPEAPDTLARVVARCLEKDPQARWPSAGALLDALADIDATAPAPRGAQATAVAHTIESLPVARASIPPGEERVVAILLADQILDREALASAVRTHGGHLLPVMEDRAIGLFGAEAWEGDEIERAAAAAVEGRHTTRFLSVASGRASYSGVTGVAGAALDEAEQGCLAQLPGVALNSHAARALREHHPVETRASGLAELMERGSRLPVATQLEEQATPTVGRAPEKQRVEEAIERVLDEGSARGVWLLGPPGIGKTHLRRWSGWQFATRAAGPVTWLRASAGVNRTQRAFSLFSEALRAVAIQDTEQRGAPRMHATAPLEERQAAVRSLASLAFDKDELEASAPFFGELLDVPFPESLPLQAARAEPQLMHDRLRLALEDWIVAAVDRGPVAMLFEDLHWADTASLDLLESLLTHLDDCPLFIVGTARPSFEERRDALMRVPCMLRARLRGLSTEEVGALASDVLGAPLASSQLETLSTHTAGNPLFVEQIAATLREGGGFESGDTLPLPFDVEAAVQSRLDHLAPAAKEISKRAAVLGDPFSADDLVGLGTPAPETHLATLVRQELLASRPRPRSRGGRTYRFRSPVVRDVAYAMVAEPVRRDLHLRVARMLAGRPEVDAETLASHFARAGDGEAAAGWYVVAAEEAVRRGDLDAALSLAERALALPVDRRARATAELVRCDAFEVRGDLEGVDRAVAAVFEASPDDAQRARAEMHRAIWSFRTGRREDAIATARAAVEAARRSGDPGTRAMTRGRQAVILSHVGDPRGAREAVDEARALATEGPARLMAHVEVWSAQVAAAEGDLRARRDGYQAAVTAYEASGDIRRAAGAAMNLADVWNRVGAYAKAERALVEVVERCRRVGNPLMALYARVNLAYALLMQDRAREAVDLLDSSADEASKLGDRRLVRAMAGYRARAELRLGASVALLERAAKLAREAAEEKDELGEALITILVSDVALSLGQHERALTASAHAMAIRERLGGLEEDEMLLFVGRVRALLASSQPEAAEQVVQEGRARIRALADAIEDPELRRGFERDIPSHQWLLSEVTLPGGGTSGR